MNTRERAPLDAILVLGVLSVLGSCTGSSAEGCSTNDDCGSGRVCNILARQCVRDYETVDAAELQFLGSFDCEVDSAITGTETDVTGRVRGEITPMVSAVQCGMTDDGLSVFFVGVGPSDSAATTRQRYAMLLKVPVFGTVNRTYDVEPDILSSPDPDRFVVSLTRIDEVSGETGDWVGIGVAGSLNLSGSASAGAALHGELNVQLVAVGDRGVGDPCTSDDECNVNSYLGCFGEFGCSTPCDTQADCSPTASICTTIYAATADDEAVELCLQPCQVDDDCDPSLHCANTSDGQGVCGPALLIGLSDDNRLGSRCTTQSECGDTQSCWVFVEGNPGVCASACDGPGDCGPYLEANPVCLQAGSYGFCAQGCESSRHCPDDLECATDVLACLPPEVLTSQ